MQDATVLAKNVSIIATTDDEIEKTTSVGVSASFVGATGNSSTATIQNLVQAQAVNADLTAEEDVTIQAYADHYARASANGGAFGAIAAGGMTAEVVQGGLTSGGVDVPEVLAQIGNGTKIHATGISLKCTVDRQLARYLGRCSRRLGSRRGCWFQRRQRSIRDSSSGRER